MDERKQENLKELFEKFFDAEQAQKHLDDVQEAERIIEQYPAPEPDDMLIANIKAEIAMRLPAERTHIYDRAAYRIASVAAAVIILAAVGLRMFEKESIKPIPIVTAGINITEIIPAAIWDSEDIAVDDMNLANFATQIDQIESDLLALQAGDDGLDGDNAIMELEVELMEVEGDFWKG